MEEDGPNGHGGSKGADAPGTGARASLRPDAPSSLRPSLRPSGPPAGRSHNLRVVFAAIWIGVQAALILTAGRRADGAFGFRMFSESSTIKLALYRELEGGSGRVHVEGGVWTAAAADGTIHRHTWYDRVPSPFWVFDQEMHASYGASAQLARLQLALDDVAAHVPNDAETRRFVLEVTVRHNGREPVVHRLASAERRVVRPVTRSTTTSGAGGADGGT